MELITGLAALAAMLTFVMIYDGAGFITGLREVGELLSRWGELPKGTTGMLVQLFLLALAVTVCTDLHVYLAIALGHLAKKNRVAMSVIAFVGINVAVSMLATLIGRLSFSHVDMNIALDTFEETMNTVIFYGSKALWAMLAWTILKSVGFFFGTDAILSRHLNLE